jgi:hypothetical protein
MKPSWKVWAVGLALVLLLAAGVGVAAMRRDPCGADELASKIEIGMPLEEAEALLGLNIFSYIKEDSGTYISGTFPDSSLVVIQSDPVGRVESVRVQPPQPDPPLTRIHRNLARVFPFLGK